MDVNSRAGEGSGEAGEPIVGMPTGKVHHALPGVDPGWAASHTADHNTSAMPAMPDKLFARLDDDKNACLDKAEVKEAAEVDRSSARIDKNNDGRITRNVQRRPLGWCDSHRSYGPQSLRVFRACPSGAPKGVR
jgi:hypothetical protein